MPALSLLTTASRWKRRAASSCRRGKGHPLAGARFQLTARSDLLNGPVAGREMCTQEPLARHERTLWHWIVAVPSARFGDCKNDTACTHSTLTRLASEGNAMDQLATNLLPLVIAVGQCIRQRHSPLPYAVQPDHSCNLHGPCHLLCKLPAHRKLGRPSAALSRNCAHWCRQLSTREQVKRQIQHCVVALKRSTAMNRPGLASDTSSSWKGALISRWRRRGRAGSCEAVVVSPITVVAKPQLRQLRVRCESF